MKTTINSYMARQLNTAFKVKKHIPYKLLRAVVNSRQVERNLYTLTADYTSEFPLSELKQALIKHADSINTFMENIDTNSYADLQTPDEIEDFKMKFIENILYFFKEADLVELFTQIEPMNFNTQFETVCVQMPGNVLKTSKKLGTRFVDKSDVLKLGDDLRAAFDHLFLNRHRYTVYGVYEHSQKFDKEKINLFHENQIFSLPLVDEILNEERESYFQKGADPQYWGVVSFKVVKEEWRK